MVVIIVIETKSIFQIWKKVSDLSSKKSKYLSGDLITRCKNRDPIIAILIVIAGILTLLVGIGSVAIGPIIGISLVFIAFGVISLAIGIAYLAMGYGLWKGRGWAWTISIIVLIIGIIVDIISLPRTIATGYSNTGSSLSGVIVSIGISAFILYYLYRPHVKAYFGRAAF